MQLDYLEVIDAMIRTGDALAVPSPAQFSSRQLAAAAGVLGVALGTLGGVIIAPVWRFPGTTSTGAQITSFVLSHRTDLLIGMLLNTIGVTLWLVFAAGLWSQLHRRPDADGFLTACFAFGMVAMVALLLVGFVAMFVLVYRVRAVVDARLLYDLTFGPLAISGAPTAIALGAYAALNLQIPILPRSTGRLAIVAAIAHVALLGSFLPASGFFSLEGQVITAIPATLFLWIAYTGVAMFRLEPSRT